MRSSIRLLCLVTIGVSPLAAQAAPGNAVPTMRLASALEGDSREITVNRSAVTVGLDREAMVMAYRRSARIACRIGLPDALGGARRDAEAGLGAVGDQERKDAMRTIDSAYTSLVQSGGCLPLMNGANVQVVDGVEGFAWNTPLSKIGKASKGSYTDDGLLVLARDAKLGGVKGEMTMTFTAAAGSERLISGRYRLAIDASSCGQAWDAIEREIVARHPALRTLRSKDASATACEATDLGRWTTAFRNPDTDALEVSMMVRHGSDGRSYVLVDYLGLPSASR